MNKLISLIICFICLLGLISEAVGGVCGRDRLEMLVIIMKTAVNTKRGNEHSSQQKIVPICLCLLVHLFEGIVLET